MRSTTIQPATVRSASRPVDARATSVIDMASHSTPPATAASPASRTRVLGRRSAAPGTTSSGCSQASSAPTTRSSRPARPGGRAARRSRSSASYRVRHGPGYRPMSRLMRTPRVSSSSDDTSAGDRRRRPMRLPFRSRRARALISVAGPISVEPADRRQAWWPAARGRAPRGSRGPLRNRPSLDGPSVATMTPHAIRLPLFWSDPSAGRPRRNG
jgi:hypothetical protein